MNALIVVVVIVSLVVVYVNHLNKVDVVMKAYEATRYNVSHIADIASRIDYAKYYVNDVTIDDMIEDDIMVMGMHAVSRDASVDSIDYIIVNTWVHDITDGKSFNIKYNCKATKEMVMEYIENMESFIVYNIVLRDTFASFNIKYFN